MLITSLPIMKITLVITFIATLTLTAEAAKILGVFPIPSISHQVVYNAVLEELLRRGHEVTVITNDPIQANYTQLRQINLGPMSYKFMRERMNAAGFGETKPWIGTMLTKIVDLYLQLQEKQLKSPEIQELLHSGETFDLVIFEYIFTPAFHGVICKFPAPYIGVSSLAGLIQTHQAVGNPTHPGYLPEVALEFTDKMNFYERTQSFVYYMFFQYLYYYYSMPKQDALSKKYISEDCPYVGDIEKNVSLVLVNTHYAINFPRPNVPAVIEFGGAPMHLPKPQALPQDLKEFLDNAKAGVIYFSLGSNVRSDKLTEYKRNQFINAFKRLKQKVLWKFESDELPNQPDNVKISKWLPQADVLAHPNVRVFITQGGLQSTGEAIQNLVPLVLVPMVGDQELNAKKLTEMGCGIRVGFSEITSDQIYDALMKVMNNSLSYKENIKEYSSLLRDQPQQPIEKAVWWIEYVLRHKGAKHMRTAAVDMPLYQYLLLDVIGALLAVFLVALSIIYYILKSLISLTSSKTKTD